MYFRECFCEPRCGDRSLLEEISLSEALRKEMKDRGKGTVIAGKG